MQTLELTASYIDSFINTAKVTAFTGDLVHLQPVDRNGMPLTTKNINIGSPLIIKPPKMSPRKEIRFGALIKSQRANQIKQESLELIEKSKAEGIIQFMSS
jgi:hypothetical protein